MKSKLPKNSSFQKKLAGLVAAGAAGGLGYQAEGAIQYLDITDQSVGFGPGDASNISIDLGPVINSTSVTSPIGNINIQVFSSSPAFIYGMELGGLDLWKVDAQGAPLNFNFGDSANFSIAASTTPNIVWNGNNTTSAASIFGAPSSETPANYYMFQFDNAGTPNFGWLRISLDIDSTTKPSLTIYEWAYEDSGASITAGQVPEPTSLTLGAAAAALLLGGRRGVRKYRSRKQENAS